MTPDELDVVINRVARDVTTSAPDVGADLAPRVLTRVDDRSPRRWLVTALMSVGAVGAAIAVAVVWVRGRPTEAPVDEPPPLSRLVWVDPQGQEQPVWGDRVARYENARVSPDGKHLAVVEWSDGASYLTVEDWSSGAGDWSRFRFLRVGGRSVVWSRQNEPPRLYAQSDPVDIGDGQRTDHWSTSHTGTHQYVAVSSAVGSFADVISGSLQFVVARDVPGRGGDIELVDSSSDGAGTPLVATPFDESNPSLSPDRRWIAYQSDASGTVEVYVRPMPPAERQWRVSLRGGVQPVWSPDGSALYYIGPAGPGQTAAMMSVPVRTDTDITFGPPRTLFAFGSYQLASTGIRSYDVSPDGRFLMIRPVAPRQTE